MRPIAAEEGFTLIELMVGMTLMIVVLGATLTSFNSFGNTTRLNQLQNDAQNRTRVTLERIARDLRNAATATRDQPLGIEKAGAHDIVFLTVGDTRPAGSLNTRNIERVRYCLNTGSGRLWRQRQAWTTAVAPAYDPATTTQATCIGAPPPGWTASTGVASDIVNGPGRPAWTFNPAGFSSTVEITRIQTEVYVDLDPSARPRESRLVSGVYLRNQNRKPAASFDATATGDGQVLLDAGASTDPEGEPLTYTWFDHTAGVEIGGGMVCDCPSQGLGARSFRLVVQDPGGLEDQATAVVTVK